MKHRTVISPQNFLNSKKLSNEESKFINEQIEQILAPDFDFNNLESEIALLLFKHFENKSEQNIFKNDADLEMSTKVIEKQAKKAFQILKKQVKKRLKDNSEFDDYMNDDNHRKLNKEAKNQIKKQIQNFIIYEIYQFMNPRRISGETKKQNYAHNLAARGEKVARKYTGGKESDLKEYGDAEVQRLKMQAKRFRSNDSALSRG